NAIGDSVAHRIHARIRASEHDDAVTRPRPQQRLARVPDEHLVTEAELLSIAACERHALLPLPGMKLGPGQSAVGASGPHHGALGTLGSAPESRELCSPSTASGQLLEVLERDLLRCAVDPANWRVMSGSFDRG